MTTIPTIATSLALQQPSSQMFGLRSAQSPCGCCYSSTLSTPMALDGSSTGRRSRSSQTLCVVKSNPFATCSNTPRLVPRTSIPQPPYTTRIHTMSEETATKPSANNTAERALAPSVPTTTATALVRWAVSDSYVDLPCRWYRYRTQCVTGSCRSTEGDGFASATKEESNDLVPTPRELPTYTNDMMSQACRQAAQRVLQPLVKIFFDVAEATANSNDTHMHSVCSLLIARVMDTSGEESATNVIEANAGHTNKTHNGGDDTVQVPARRCDKVLVEYTTRDVCEEWVWGRVASLETTHNRSRNDTSAGTMQALPNGLVTTPCACDSDNMASLNTTLTSPQHTSRPSHAPLTLLQDGTVEELYCHTRRRGVLLWLVHMLFQQLLSRQVQARTSHLSTCSVSESNTKVKKGDNDTEMCHDESLGLSMYVLVPPTMLSSSPKKCESTKSQVHCLLHPALAERQQLVTRSLHVMTHRVPCLRDPHSRTHNSDNDKEARAEVTAIRIGTRSECLELLRAGLRSYHTLYSTAATKGATKKNVNDLSACHTIPLPLYIVFHRYRGYTTSIGICGDVMKTGEELCWRYVSSLSVIDLAPLPMIPPSTQYTMNGNTGDEFTGEGNACVVDTLTKLPLFMHAESGTGRHYSDMSCAAHAVRREPAMQLLAAHVLGSHHYASSLLTHYVNQEQRYHTVLFGEVVTRHGTHTGNNAPVNTETNSTADAIKAFRDLFTLNDWLVRVPLPPPRHTLPPMTLPLSPTALCEPAAHSPLARPPLAPSSPIHTNTHYHNNTGVTSTAAVTPILVPPSPAHPPQPTEQLRQPNEEHAPLSLTLLSSPTAHNGGEDYGSNDGVEGRRGSGVSPLSMSSALAATGMAANASSGSRSCERSMTSMSTSATGTDTSDASDASHLVRILNRFVFPDAAMVQQTMSKQGQPLVMSSSTSSSLSSSITRPRNATTPSASMRDVASAQPTVKPTLPTSRLAEPVTTTTTTTCEDKAQSRAVRIVPAHQQVTRVTVESAKVTTHVTPPQQYGLQTSTSYVHTRPSETRYTTTLLTATGSHKAPAPAHLPSTTTTTTTSVHTVNTMNGRSNMNKSGNNGVRGTDLGMPTMACSLTSTRDMRAATQGSGPRVLPYKTRLVWTEKEAAAIRTTNTRNDVIYTTAMLQGEAGPEKEIRRTHAVGMPRHAPPTQRSTAAVAATVTHTTR